MLTMVRTRDKGQIWITDGIASGAGPTNGTSGTAHDQAYPGAVLVDLVNARFYINRGTKASPTWEHASRVVSAVGVASNGAGAVTATGFKVGDRVVTALNATDLTDGIANFESVITVADQIQQSSATNLSAKKHLFQVQR